MLEFITYGELKVKKKKIYIYIYGSLGLGWERYQKSGGSHKYTNMSSIVWRTAIERAPIFSYILFGNLLHISSHPLRRADPLSPLLIPFSILLPMDQVLYMYAVSLVSSVRFFFFFTGMQCYYRVAHILSTQFFFWKVANENLSAFPEMTPIHGFYGPKKV